MERWERDIIWFFHRMSRIIHLGTFFFFFFFYLFGSYNLYTLYTFSSVFLLIHSAHIQNTRICQYIKKPFSYCRIGSKPFAIAICQHLYEYFITRHHTVQQFMPYVLWHHYLDVITDYQWPCTEKAYKIC